MYNRVIKRCLDFLFALAALILLSWLFVLLSILIFLDDPGPVIFTQKRFGRNCQFFKFHKFRSMKRSAPHNVPTHLLKDPKQHFTRMGGFLRRYSLDELPQLWDILVGKMSVVGPRPALWNQEDLIAAREACGANAPRPGLTGLAQINGRDELDIDEKARFDGIYAAALKKGGWTALRMDMKCFFGTFLRVATADGVVEGTKNSEAAQMQASDQREKKE